MFVKAQCSQSKTSISQIIVSLTALQDKSKLRRGTGVVAHGISWRLRTEMHLWSTQSKLPITAVVATTLLWLQRKLQLSYSWRQYFSKALQVKYECRHLRAKQNVLRGRYNILWTFMIKMKDIKIRETHGLQDLIPHKKALHLYSYFKI